MVARKLFDENGNCLNPDPPETRREFLLRLIRYTQDQLEGSVIESSRKKYRQELLDLQQRLQEVG